MKTHERVIVSKCCGYKTTYWQTKPSFRSCNRCGEICDTKSIDLKIMEKLGQGHYRPVSNKNKGFGLEG